MATSTISYLHDTILTPTSTVFYSRDPGALLPPGLDGNLYHLLDGHHAPAGTIHYAACHLELLQARSRSY
eukprot:1160031-Pelagomonas_calceolata.AAC.6